MKISSNTCKPPVFILLGPTAVGKTALIAHLAPFLSGVIYADTAVFYRDFAIGSAKPTLAEQQLIPHYMLNGLALDETIDTIQFNQKADGYCSMLLNTLAEEQKFPLITGGSLFYLKNFLFGAPQTPPANPKMRAMVQAQLANEGAAALYKKLQTVDPISSKKIHVNDHYRLTRALEVFYTSGKPLADFMLPTELRGNFNFKILILERPRDQLYQRINNRVEAMFEAGLEHEVAQLKALGAHKGLSSMKAIGYAEWFDPQYQTTAEIKAAIKLNSRHYAKRQLTFLQQLKPHATNFAADDVSAITKYIERQIANFYQSQ